VENDDKKQDPSVPKRESQGREEKQGNCWEGTEKTPVNKRSQGKKNAWGGIGGKQFEKIKEGNTHANRATGRAPAKWSYSASLNGMPSLQARRDKTKRRAARGYRSGREIRPQETLEGGKTSSLKKKKSSEERTTSTVPRPST